MNSTQCLSGMNETTDADIGSIGGQPGEDICKIYLWTRIVMSMDKLKLPDGVPDRTQFFIIMASFLTVAQVKFDFFYLAENEK